MNNFCYTNDYLIFTISGSYRNKIIRFLIFYSDHFCIYNHSNSFLLERRSLFGNKNQNNSIKKFLHNIENSCEKIIIIKPKESLITLLKMKTNGNKSMYAATLIYMIYDLYKKTSYKITHYPWWYKGFDIMNPKKIIRYHSNYIVFDKMYKLEEYR